jgi:serine/threonine protein kinase
MSEASQATPNRSTQPAPLGEPDRQLSHLWRQGQRPDVHDFLARVGTLSLAQLAAVLAVDQRERWQSGERILAEAYLKPYPALQADIEKALELVYGEFLLREERGESPPLEEYVQRFPQYAERLRQQWNLHRALASDLSHIEPGEAEARRQETVLSSTQSAGQQDAAAESTRAEQPEKIRSLYLGAPSERYTLTRLHAQGGLGQVWLARDATLGREVALKELRPERAGYQPLLDRFLEEATITGQLEHPGIVPVYELAQRPESNQPFYTMRFIKGRTLSEASQAYHQKRQTGHVGGLDLVALLNAFVAVCNAVAYAHARGVIHRDLKGRNVVLGDFGEVIVLDWGLAKARSQHTQKADQRGAETSEEMLPRVRIEDHGWREKTAEGQVLGTPGYMAPEQALGKQAEIDERTDIYGLGAILYEILTGQPPFTGESLEQIQRKVIHEPPVPPRALVPATPRALEAICLRGLAKKPVDRYASAAELGQDVQRYLADEPVLAYREPLPARLRRWMRRHRTLVTGLAALLLTAVVALGVGIVLIGRKEQEAMAARGRAEANYQLARDAVDQYYVKITENPRLKEAGLRDLRKELLEEAGKFYARFIHERGQEPGLEYEVGRAHVYLAMVREEMGALAEAIDEVQKGRNILQPLVDGEAGNPAYRNQLALASNRLGHMFQKTGKLAEAQEAYLQASTLYQQLADAFPQEADYAFGLAKALFYQGWLARVRRQPAEAEKLYLLAIALQTPLLDSPSQRVKFTQSIAGVQNDLSTLYLTQFQGRETEAEQTLLKTLALHQQLVDADPQNPEFQSDLAICQNSLGFLYSHLHRYADAEHAFQAMLKLSEPLADRHHDAPRYQVNLVTAQRNLAVLYRDMNQWEAAEKYEQRALTLQKQLVDSWPQVPEYRKELAALHANRAKSYQNRRLWNKAKQEFLEAIQLLEHLAETHTEGLDYSISAAEYSVDLGDLLLMADKPQAALQSYAKARERLEAILKQTPKDLRATYYLSRTHEGIARSLSQLGRYAEAVQAWDRAIPLAEGPAQGDLRLGRAVTLAQMHRTKEAIATAEKVLEQDNSAWTAYNAARVFAVAATIPGLDPQRAEHYAARAVQLLRKAVENDARNREDMKTEQDFESLRKRADFKQLLADIEKKTSTLPKMPN